MNEYHVFWLDEGGCDIFDMEVTAPSLPIALETALYTLAREDLDKYEEVVRDATKVTVEVSS